MPELPDVETFRRYLDATGLHQTIEGVTVEDSRVVAGASPEELEAYLRDRQLTGSDRHGKHLFAALDRGGWLELHFGMTGYLAYFRDPEEAPAYSHVRIRFDNGYQLAFVDRRKLGHVAPVPDLEAYLRELNLGVDALAPGLDAEGFRSLAEGRRGQVKCWLMDQETLAGLGNVYSDEVLFHAGLYPKYPLERLSPADLDYLFRALREVLAQAIEARVDPERMPADFLVPRRGKGAVCPRCGTELETLKACGRTAYWCPHCQPVSGPA